MDNEPVEAVEVGVAMSLCSLVLALLLGLACTGPTVRKRRCRMTRRGGSLLCWALAASEAAASGTFSTIDTTAAGVSKNGKYNGAAAVGGNVYFAPYVEDAIGVLAVASSVFSTIDVTAAGVTGQYKYHGAAAVGDKVYFAPLMQEDPECSGALLDRAQYKPDFFCERW